MRFKTLLEYRIRKDINVTFKPFILANGQKVMGLITQEGKHFVIEASRKNFETFKEWPKATKRKQVSVDLRPTIRSVKTSDGKKIQTTRIRADFELPGREGGREMTF